MLKIRFTNKFKKDNKLLKKRHYDLSLMDNVIEMLCFNRSLYRISRMSYLAGLAFNLPR